MGGNQLWLPYPSAAATVLDNTQLNSLADGSVCALSSELDNSTDKHLFADVQLDLASLTISSATAYVDVFFVPSVDGTNYPDWTSGAVANYHNAYKAGAIPVKAVSATTARADAQELRVPPGKYKVAVRNGLGVAFASSGNTLKLRTYSGSWTG